MLPATLIAEIDHLLKEGQLSQRQIAKRMGVSRGTVSAVARGSRELHDEEPEIDSLEDAQPLRCPVCGYRVYLPCLVCSVRIYRQQQLLSEMARRDAEHAKVTSALRTRDGRFPER
jgi:transcriptional regulator with XRE-family HTH domain